MFCHSYQKHLHQVPDLQYANIPKNMYIKSFLMKLENMWLDINKENDLRTIFA